MLIQSSRFKPGDIKAWEWFEDVDRCWPLRDLPDRAVAALKAFAPDYVSVSWGKDSTALAYLAFLSGIRAPLVWVRFGRFENPDCVLVRDDFLSRFEMPYEEIEIDKHPDEVSVAQMFRSRRGQRYATGIRSEESRGRAIRARKWGVSSPNTCAPLIGWTSREVFAFLAQFRLPVHPAYACSLWGALSRHEIRVDAIGGSEGTGRGRAEWERAYYPEIVR